MVTVQLRLAPYWVLLLRVHSRRLSMASAHSSRVRGACNTGHYANTTLIGDPNDDPMRLSQVNKRVLSRTDWMQAVISEPSGLRVVVTAVLPCWGSASNPRSSHLEQNKHSTPGIATSGPSPPNEYAKEPNQWHSTPMLRLI